MEGIEKLSQYFEENQEYCYRVAYHYTQNSELAKDALQEAIIKAMVHYSQLRNEKYMKTWFYRILINECKNMLKKFPRREELDRRSCGPRSKPENCRRSLSGKLKTSVPGYYLSEIFPGL